MSLMDNLLNLFRVDAQVRGLRSRVDQARRFLNAQQRKLDEVLERRAELESRRKQHQAHLANLEVEIARLNERIDKLRAELNTANTNKEYTALLTEINTFKAERGDVESQVITEMEKVESIAREIEGLAGDVRDRTIKRDAAKKDLEERSSEVAERLTELEAERAVACSHVPQEALDAFNQLADRYEGEALAAIETIDKRNREYACGSCNMHVPFEKVSRLLSVSTELICCNVCQRILYMQEETRGSLAGKK